MLKVLPPDAPYKSTFKVQIGDDVTTGVTAEELIDFIDERVEKVDNYEEAVKASMTSQRYQKIQTFSSRLQNQ